MMVSTKSRTEADTHVQDNAVYKERRNVDKGHFISYWYQIDEIAKCQSNTILEIGVGNRFLSDYWIGRGLDVVTLDIEKELGPSIVGTISSLPFADNSFDLVVCFEVLEHLSFDQFSQCVSELGRVSKGKVIISIPDASRVYRILLRLPRIKLQRCVELVPGLASPPVPTGGAHYWEVGVKGFPLEKITQSIESAGLRIERTYRIFEYVRHRFFILNKDCRLRKVIGPLTKIEEN